MALRPPGLKLATTWEMTCKMVHCPTSHVSLITAMVIFSYRVLSELAKEMTVVQATSEKQRRETTFLKQKSEQYQSQITSMKVCVCMYTYVS